MNASGISTRTARLRIAPGAPRHGRRASHIVGLATVASGNEPAEADQPPEHRTNLPLPLGEGPRNRGEGSLRSSLIEVDDARAAGEIDRVDTNWITDHLRRAVDAIDHHIARVSVRLIDETQMKALHQQALGDAIVTDVLSFDASTDNNSIEADIAVCVDVAHRESSARNHSIERELLLYALHGLLHCCGYDDHDQAGYQAMHAEEDRILSAIGVGATFDSIPKNPGLNA